MNRTRIKIGVVGSIITAFCVYCIFLWTGMVLHWYHGFSGYSPLFLTCEGILLALFAVVGCLLLHLSSLATWSDHLDIPSIALLYTMYIISKIVTNHMFSKFEEQTKKFRKTQEQLILAGLEKHRETAYGKDFKFADIHSLEELKARHPLTTYSHYQKYIDRICAGELNVMTKEKLIRLALTSGTTGKGKKIPYTNSSFQHMAKPMMFIASGIVKKNFPNQSPMQRRLFFYTAPKNRPVEAGIPLGPGSMIEPSYKKYFRMNTTPISGYEISTEFEACYVHMLFGIRDRNIKSIESTFIPTVMTAFRILEEHWKQMLIDIESGSLFSKLDLPMEIRMDLESSLRETCDINRVTFLRREFEKGFEEICIRIWPKVLLVIGIDLGNSAEKLQTKYMKGLTISAPYYGGTEGCFGVNFDILKPKPYRYTLVPDSLMYEFIPIENSDDDNPETYFGDEVEVGKTYEFVITNWMCGLYRFRFGDVVKIVDFRNKCPVVEFQYRYGQLMSLRGEKVDEASMLNAVNNTIKQWPGITLVDYSCTESSLLPESEIRTGPYYYVVFIELEGVEVDTKISSDIGKELDEQLCKQAFAYKSFRNINTIGEMDVYLVKPGGFKNLKRYIIDHSTASVNQYKQPSKLKTAGAVEFILSNTVRRI